MSLSLSASADGNSVDLKLGVTTIATFTSGGVSAGAILANAAEAQGFSNALKLLTPDTLDEALKGSNQTLSANGYQRLPGGIIVQWGSALTIAGGTATFTYPIAFPTAALSTLSNVNGGNFSLSSAAPGLTNTVSTAYISNTGAAAAAGLTVRFLVIGH